MKRLILLLMLILVFSACENNKDPLPPDDSQKNPENFLQLRGNTYAITSASYNDLAGIGMILLELEKEHDAITIIYVGDKFPIGTFPLHDKTGYNIDIVADEFEYLASSGKVVLQKQDSLYTIYSEDMILGQSHPPEKKSYPGRFYYKGVVPKKNPNTFNKSN